MAAFVAVAEARRFTAAARTLKTSPSAITRLIAGLEDHLEVRLLQRTTRSVALTEAGARYLERARRVLAELADAEAAARSAQLAPAGRLVVAAPNVFGRLHVAPLIAELLTAHPAITAELVLSDRNASLIDDGIDVAVRIGALADSTLHARAAGKTRRVVVGAPSYLAAHKRPRKPSDLVRHRLLQFTGLGAEPSWRFTRGGDHAVAIAPRFSSTSADAVIELARAGAGLAMVLSYQVAAAIRERQLEIVLARHEPAPVPIQLVYPGGRLLSATVRAFIDLAAAQPWNFVDL